MIIRLGRVPMEGYIPPIGEDLGHKLGSVVVEVGGPGPNIHSDYASSFRSYLVLTVKRQNIRR